MDINDLKLNKKLLEIISNFKREIGDKEKETGIKFIHCSSKDFNKVYRTIFLKYGFKIFNLYWKEFDYVKSEYPNKELYITLDKLNKGAALHYFHNNIFQNITDIIIDSVIVGDENYLYSGGDIKNYDSKSIYLDKYRIIFCEFMSDGKFFGQDTELTNLFEKLDNMCSHGTFLLTDISKATYYKVHNDKIIEKLKNDLTI